MQDLVSIITPVYNSAKYLKETMDSVKAQSYEHWEMLLVDDCSEDGSADIIKAYANQDDRIKYISLEINSGAAAARNRGLAESRGRYIAYLDADDIWLKDKLKKQIAFMKKNNAYFTCCDYDKIEDDGTLLKKVVHMPETITYNQLLRNTIIQTVGVIVDTKHVDVRLLNMPNVRRGQDSATWLKMLRNGVEFHGQNEVLALYRRVPQSLSSNKLNAIKRTWYLYRGVEKLGLAKSVFCIAGWAYNASKKRVYLNKSKTSYKQLNI